MQTFFLLYLVRPEQIVNIDIERVLNASWCLFLYVIAEMFILHYDILCACQPQKLNIILSLIIKIHLVLCSLSLWHETANRYLFNFTNTFYVIYCYRIIDHGKYFMGTSICGVI